MGLALGSQAGEQRFPDNILEAAGYASVRRAAETPFHMVIEAASNDNGMR